MARVASFVPGLPRDDGGGVDGDALSSGDQRSDQRFGGTGGGDDGDDDKDETKDGSGGSPYSSAGAAGAASRASACATARSSAAASSISSLAEASTAEISPLRTRAMRTAADSRGGRADGSSVGDTETATGWHSAATGIGEGSVVIVTVSAAATNGAFLNAK